MSIIENITTIFQQRFGSAPRYIACAPGRVNLLGEHVDYNDGFVLPAAIDRATYIAFSPASAPQTRLVAADFNQESAFALETLAAKTDPEGKPLSAWARYPAGVMWALNESSLAAPNMQAVFASDVPRGSGLSSSASVEMAFALAWQTLGGWTRSPMERALLGQKAENKYVGVNCGIMDQFASACGEQNKLLYLDCRSLEYQTVPLPQDVAIVIADTTVRRSLASSNAYNDLRAACEEAVRLLKIKLPDLRSLRDVSVADFHKHKSGLPALVARRAQHVVEEINRSQQATFLLNQHNIRAFGRLMNECHTSLRDLFEVSCPELDVMVRIAQALPACYGARLTGAGFGGCTVNLVARDAAAAFASALAAAYESETGHHPEIYICNASAGARLL